MKTNNSDVPVNVFQADFDSHPADRRFEITSGAPISSHGAYFPTSASTFELVSWVVPHLNPAQNTPTNARSVERAVVAKDWDGEGSLATDPGCLRLARSLARRLDEAEMADAYVAPLHSGGLGFFWTAGEFENRSVSVEIEPDETGVSFLVYCGTDNGDEDLNEETQNLEEVVSWLMDLRDGTDALGD